MNARAGTHPTADILRALGTGKLDEAAVEPVLAHVETCHDCQTRLSSLSGDSVLSRLRAAHAGGATRAETTGRPGQAQIDVLPELRNHPQYEVLRELGRGGMGVVYLAKNKPMEREEVLKVVSKQLLGQDGAAERFLREIRAAARLNHPNIVTAYTTLQVGDLLVLAMEYVEGDDLAKVVKTHGPLPVANACFYMRQAALGLQHASEKGMIHRDIKPGNLILAREGKKHVVKILDFGLAKATRDQGTSHDLTGDNKMLGTPDYIAPEQAMDATRADIRADIYSLGCSLHYLLTGNAPFKAHSLYEILHMHMSTNAAPVHELRPDVPAALSAVIAKMMAKDPARRYQTPADVAKALTPFVTGGVKVLPAARAASVPDACTTISEVAGLRTASRAETASPAGRQETMAEQPAPLVQLSPHVAADRPAGGPGGRKVLIGAGLGVGTLLILALGMALVAGAVLMLQTKHGTIVLKNLPPDAVVLVDNERVTLKLKGDGKPIEIQKAPGKHELVVRRDGFKIQVKEVLLAAGDHKPIELRWVPLEIAAGPAGPGKDDPAAGKEKKDTTTAPIVANPAAYVNMTGEWKVSDVNELVQVTLHEQCELIFGDFTWTDYDFTFEMKKAGGIFGIGPLYRVTGTGCGRWGMMQGIGAGGLGIVREPTGPPTAPVLQLNQDRWYKFCVRLRGTSVEVFIDDHSFSKREDGKNLQGAVGLWTGGVGRFRNLRVTDPAGKVLFAGLPKLPPAPAGQWLPATEAASADQLHCLTGHGAPVTSVAFCRDGRQLVSASNGNFRCVSNNPKADFRERATDYAGPGSTLRLWDSETGKALGRPVVLPWGLVRLAVTPGSDAVLSATAHALPEAKGKAMEVQCQVQQWGVAGGKLQGPFVFPQILPRLFDLTMTADGRKALALGDTCSLWEWDVENKILLRELPAATGRAGNAVLAPDGGRALLVRSKQPLTEIDLATSAATGRWTETVGDFSSLAYRRDGLRLLTGGNDGTVRLWDVATGKHQELVGSQNTSVLAVAFSPDGKRALTGSTDNTVRLWDVDGRKELARFTGHTGPVRTVAFSPDGLRAASGSADYTIRLWRLPP